MVLCKEGCSGNVRVPPAISGAERGRRVNERVERKAYRIGDAAEAVGISRSELYRLIGLGIVRTVRFGNRARVTAAELERLATEGFLPPQASP
jgi:excisionase family DNA binding protein